MNSVLQDSEVEVGIGSEVDVDVGCEGEGEGEVDVSSEGEVDVGSEGEVDVVTVELPGDLLDQLILKVHINHWTTTVFNLLGPIKENVKLRHAARFVLSSSCSCEILYHGI